MQRMPKKLRYKELQLTNVMLLAPSQRTSERECAMNHLSSIREARAVAPLRSADAVRVMDFRRSRRRRSQSRLIIVESCWRKRECIAYENVKAEDVLVCSEKWKRHSLRLTDCPPAKPQAHRKTRSGLHVRRAYLVSYLRRGCSHAGFPER